MRAYTNDAKRWELQLKITRSDTEKRMCEKELNGRGPEFVTASEASVEIDVTDREYVL